MGVSGLLLPTPASTTSRSPKLNLLTCEEAALVRLMEESGRPSYRAHQVLRWLYAKRVHAIEAMTDLSRTDRAWLEDAAEIVNIETRACQTSEDGTKKFVFALEDGSLVESVLIPDGRRLTLCLSSQVGCTFDCTFCLTGTLGLTRNLKPHEIVGQVLRVQDQLAPDRRLTNLVFMGMGEPLANFEAVSEAIARLTNVQWGVGIPARRITISTAGLASRIKDVAPLGVNLAISLNATTEAQRAALMPTVNRSYSLDALMQACRTFPLKARDRLTFEYVLLAGQNDSVGDAHRLVTMLRGFRCKINVIPFNEFPDNPLRRPRESTILSFQAVLRQAGFDVFIRKSKGPDVLGACGQLGVRVREQTTALPDTP